MVITIKKPEQPAGSTFFLSARPANPNHTLLDGTYVWDLGDGRTATRDKPKIVYRTPGHYTIKLRVDVETNTQENRGSTLMTAEYTIAVTGNGVAGLNPAGVQIHPWLDSNNTGEIPVDVRFGYRSEVELTRYRWTFGDGAQGKIATPKRRYKYHGRFEVQLAYTDAKGRKGIARTHVSLRPSKTDLFPGLTDMKRLGIYSPGLKSSDRKEFNDRRYKELVAMNVDTILPGIEVRENFWLGPDSARDGLMDRLDQAEHYEMKVGLAITADKKDWHVNDEGANEDKPEVWRFNKGEAENNLQKVKAIITRNPDDWDIVNHEAVDWLLLGHEMGEWANRAQRELMHARNKAYFPNKLTLPYYGGIAVAFERGNTEKQLGGKEGDHVFVAVNAPHTEDAAGKKVRDSNRTLAELNRQRKWIRRTAAKNKRLWINANLPGENRNHTKDDMWSPTDILDYARVLLAEGGIELMSFRSMGRYEFDLGWGLNTATPGQKEFGFINQRLAVKTIGSWIKQSNSRRPILIIRSPEIASETGGRTLKVDYAVIGRRTAAHRAVFTLDSGETQTQTLPSEMRGSTTVKMNTPGKRTLTAHLVDRNGNHIEGTDVTVPFVALRPRTQPVHAINVGGPKVTTEDGMVYSAGLQGETLQTTARITAASDKLVYRTARQGDLSYALSVAPGRYQVTLKFIELSINDVNRRIFDVVINGRNTARNLDLRAVAGSRFRGYDIVTTARAQNGKLNIRLVSHKGKAVLSAIVVRRVN